MKNTDGQGKMEIRELRKLHGLIVLAGTKNARKHQFSVKINIGGNCIHFVQKK